MYTSETLRYPVQDYIPYTLLGHSTMTSNFYV